MEKEVPMSSPTRSLLPKRTLSVLTLATLCLYFTFRPFTFALYLPSRVSDTSDSQVPLSPPSFDYLSAHCAHLTPLPAPTYHTRLNRLADMLQSLHAVAYIAEPGASAQFFANISLDAWGLSERPFLLIVSPDSRHRVNLRNPRVKVAILTPAFETSRAQLLPIPLPDGASVTWLEWTDDTNPYEVAIRGLGLTANSRNKVIYVEGMMRHFIVEGLQHAAGKGVVIRSAPHRLMSIRENKSHQELDLLKCANEVTLLAIRAVREHVRIGMRESQVRSLMLNALSTAGLTSPTVHVAFGENTALSHGSGTDRPLGEADLVLVDCGGRLHGYWSDVTRTYALPESKIPEEHLTLWAHVYLAQTLASFAALSGVRASAVDEVARAHVKEAGYGSMVHRLGHGIGLSVREPPYLRSGSGEILRPGHVFSNEPGIYLPGEVGVRLEDCFYIDEHGWPIWLTAGVGGQATSALDP